MVHRGVERTEMADGVVKKAVYKGRTWKYYFCKGEAQATKSLAESLEYRRHGNNILSLISIVKRNESGKEQDLVFSLPVSTHTPAQ